MVCPVLMVFSFSVGLVMFCVFLIVISFVVCPLNCVYIVVYILLLFWLLYHVLAHCEHGSVICLNYIVHLLELVIFYHYCFNYIAINFVFN